MRSSLAFFALLISSFSLIFGDSTLIRHSSADASAEQSAFDKREAAYRANNLGVAFLEQYKAKEAIASFTQALEIKPDLLIARINLSIALYYLPDVDRAQQEAGKALAQNQNAPQPHYLLGLIARGQNRFADAIAEFEKVLKIDAADVGSNINVGQILVQEKKYEEAIGAFRRALEAEPYNETALYNLGLLLTRTGKKEEGQRLIQKFQQFKQSGAGTTLGTNYLEGGHYAEAVVSTGAEVELVDRDTPSVTFTEATAGRLQDWIGSRSPAFRPIIGRQFNISKAGNISRADDSSFLPTLNQVRDYIHWGLGSTAALFDFDGDGDLDLFWATFGEQHLYRNDGGKFTDVTDQSFALNERFRGSPIAVVAGDYDNDGKPDLLVVRDASVSLYRNLGGGRFSDVTQDAHIPSFPYLPSSAAFVDVDHDGDLDIFVAGFSDLSKPPQGRAVFPEDFAPAPNLLLRNDGNGRFTDITAAARLDKLGHAVAVVPTDFNNRRDIDLLVVNYGKAPDLYSNQRDGTFRNVSSEVGLDIVGHWTCVAAGDINQDGYTDFYLGRVDGPGLFAISDGKGKFKTMAAPPGIENPQAAQFIDYDNDGLLDCVMLAGKGVHVLRNVGTGWVDTSERAVAPNVAIAGSAPGDRRLFVAGDLDGDGDTDIIWLSAGGSLRIGLNNGGNNNHSLRVNLHGRVSNRSAIEAKVEIRAGSLYQKLETYSASPAPAPADLIFGLGKRDRPDAVRVLWPAGIVQAETEFSALPIGRKGPPSPSFMRMDITELDRKPSSCPYLYAWNGERFEFVTDFMGGGEMGYLEEPGRYNRPDSDEYVRIRGDQLKERNSRYELRVTNELEEAMFVDRLQLLAVTHPAGTDVYPNEGMSDPPKPFKLFVTRDARPPLSAVDDKGNDVLDLISRMDRRWPDDFKVDRIRGYAEEHTLTMNLLAAGSAGVPPATARRSLVEGRKRSMPERQSLSAHRGGKAAKTGNRVLARTEDSKAERVILLLTGWTDYAWSSDNVAAAQSGKTMKPPALQVKDKRGIWRTVIEDIGIPVGRPQTVTVDLTGKFLSASREVRIVTDMRIYWDQILVDTSAGNSTTPIARLDPVRADLNWRGFSAEVTPDNREPFGYDYARVSFSSPWKVMTGRYTREGDVRELLLTSDDMFAICRPGDEISLSFDASALPSLPKGWTRTFLLYSDGFSKEMDINSASPDQISPLPFHGMTRYPYTWPEHYPLTEARQRYLEKYNTRVVTSPVTSIESVMVHR
jgi:tetratricopeptide (TPR) repeat protein